MVFRAASGRRREKPLMNKIAPLISWLRMIAVRAHNNAHNMRSLVDRYFKHNVKLALGFPYTVLSGYVNALNIANRATVPFAYSPSQDSSDLMCFFVRLAEQIASPLPAKAAIDIVLNASPGCRVADYGAVARLFHDRVNLTSPGASKMRNVCARPSPAPRTWNGWVPTFLRTGSSEFVSLLI